MHKKYISFIVLSVLCFFVALGIMTSSNVAFATSTCTTNPKSGAIKCNDSVTASVVIKTSCGFTKIGDGNYNGTLANNSSVVVGGTTFTTICNSPNGYALYAVGFSGDVVGGTDLIANIGSEYNIKTGDGASNWKMQVVSTGNYGTVVPAFDPGSGGSNYANIPSDYTKVAYYSPAAGDASTESIFQPKYKATASGTQPAGTYAGQVKYTLIPTNDSLSKTIFELEYMQDFASLTSTQKTDVLKSMITDQQYTLTDNRDGKEYYIAKLRDGNVWMTQNLDHDIVTTANFYTPANTDVLNN